MPSYEGLRLKILKVYRHKTATYRRKKLKSDDFTIISNNCWGGTVYESYGLAKQSPTVGLYFMAEDYVQFVSHLREYISCELRFIDPETARGADFSRSDPRFGRFPVGVLGNPNADPPLPDVEIFFLHYHSEEEARAKWKRRCERINWDRLLVKFNDQNHCTEQEIQRFDALPFDHKICFSVHSYPQYSSVVQVPAPKSHRSIQASYEPFGQSPILDINELLNQLES